MDTRPLVEQVGGSLRDQAGGTLAQQRAASSGFGFTAPAPARAQPPPSPDWSDAAKVAAGVVIEYGPAVVSFVAPLVFGRGGGAATLLEGKQQWAGESSAIAHAEFDKDDQEITITFKQGRTYSYPCSEAEWQGFLAASSKGRYVNETFVR